MGQPKQFIDLRGRPALYYTLKAFEDCPAIGRIYAVGDRDRIKGLVARAGIGKFAGCADPGEARSLSTRSGLLMCDEDPDTVVLIHDGSRCLVTPELVGRVVAAAMGEVDGVVPAVPVSDTIKVAENGSVSATLDRAQLRAVQTPQAFRLDTLRKVYAAPKERLRTATDDASLVEDAGGRVAVVTGERTNIKLTSPDDLVLAEAILAARGIVHDGERHGVFG
jgi:2-C-methyl-D-erythritol 4-phosphate cytidylyltransferase